MTWRNHLTPDEAFEAEQMEDMREDALSTARLYAERLQVLRERCKKRAQRARSKDND